MIVRWRTTRSRVKIAIGPIDKSVLLRRGVNLVSAFALLASPEIKNPHSEEEEARVYSEYPEEQLHVS